MPTTPGPEKGDTLGSFQLKNFLDMPDDSIIYDPAGANPITFVKEVIAREAVPNIFKTRKQFYGRFITQLYANQQGVVGDGMYDSVLAAIKRAGGESTNEMKLFVCIVHVEELQQYPFPEQDNWDGIHRIANNGGIFKSYVYAGDIPKYGDTVLVSFADPSSRSEGMFEYPLVGGASANVNGAGGAGSGPGGSSSGAAYAFGNCSGSSPVVVVLPKKKKKKKKKVAKVECPEGKKMTGTDVGPDGQPIPICVDMTAEEKQEVKEKKDAKEKKKKEDDAYAKEMKAQYGTGDVEGNIKKAAEKKAKDAEDSQTPDVKKKKKKKKKPTKVSAPVNTEGGQCAPFLGNLEGPYSGPDGLQWVKIKGNSRVHLSPKIKPGSRHYGTLKFQQFINELGKVPGGENVPQQMQTQWLATQTGDIPKQYKPGWYVGDISRKSPGPFDPPHKSHQSGIGCDLTIPVKGGWMSMRVRNESGGWAFASAKIKSKMGGLVVPITSLKNKKSMSDPEKAAELAGNLDWNATLKFMKMAIPFCHKVYWYEAHIATAMALVKQKIAKGQDGWTQELLTKAKKIFRHCNVGSNQLGHANHFHVRLKRPGYEDRDGNEKI